MQIHIHKVHACLAVTCHLHFWQNNRDLSHATPVKRWWDGYPNKSQHRKLTLEKKILPIAKLLVCCDFCYFFYQELNTSCPAQLSGCPGVSELLPFRYEMNNSPALSDNFRSALHSEKLQANVQYTVIIK